MSETIKIPVSATYRIINGQPVRIAAEYVDAPVDVVARFFLERFGAPAGKEATRCT